MNSRTSLMTQQRAAVEKMLPTRIGALFMEMGTGKSRTAIELGLLRRQKIDRFIWYCPVSLKDTVQQEILKHTDCAERDIQMFDDRTTDCNLRECFWNIVGIESMSDSDRIICAANRLTSDNSKVIVDESSFIKGHNSQRTMRITHISERARYRMILSGTPISQGIIDLYAQMRFLSPKILGYNSFYSFAANHLEYSDRFPGMIVRSHNTEYIAAKIQPYVYQVTKDECLDLPPKLYEGRYFRMTATQEMYYEQAKEEILLECEDDDWSGIVIFRLFTALQQIVSGFWNRRPKRGAVELIEMPHRRLDLLMDTVTSVPSDEKIVIWAKFHHDITGIGTALRQKYGKDAVSEYHGLNKSTRNREKLRYQAGDSKFFLSMASSGGFGLNELINTEYTLYYNDEFKYINRIQSEDRTHRTGVTRDKVVYISHECLDSIDGRITQARLNKGDVVEEFKREVAKIKDKKGRIRKLVEGL